MAGPSPGGNRAELGTRIPLHQLGVERLDIQLRTTAFLLSGVGGDAADLLLEGLAADAGQAHQQAKAGVGAAGQLPIQSLWAEAGAQQPATEGGQIGEALGWIDARWRPSFAKMK